MTLALWLVTPVATCAVGIVGFAAWETWQDRRRAKALDEISEVD